MAPFSLELSASSGHTEAFGASTSNGTKTAGHIGGQPFMMMYRACVKAGLPDRPDPGGVGQDHVHRNYC